VRRRRGLRNRRSEVRILSGALICLGFGRFERRSDNRRSSVRTLVFMGPNRPFVIFWRLSWRPPGRVGGRATPSSAVTTGRATTTSVLIASRYSPATCQWMLGGASRVQTRAGASAVEAGADRHGRPASVRAGGCGRPQGGAAAVDRHAAGGGAYARGHGPTAWPARSRRLADRRVGGASGGVHAARARAVRRPGDDPHLRERRSPRWRCARCCARRRT
jgi:hypothetical protein